MVADVEEQGPCREMAASDMNMEKWLTRNSR